MFSFFSKTPRHTTVEWIGADIHSHLLPGIDDGSPDAETSVRYIQQMHELGYEKFICTPHVFKEVYPNTPQTIGSALSSLRAELGKTSVNVELSAAAEYMLDPDFQQLSEEADLLCLKNKYVLVEMSYQVETKNIAQYIFDLNVKGYKPVLAHPERYLYYHNNFQQYRRLKERGCLMQLNMLSLAGYYGKAVKQVALSLIKDGIIDLVGTDLHHDRHLQALTAFVQSGDAVKLLFDYPLKNRELFL